MTTDGAANQEIRFDQFYDLVVKVDSFKSILQDGWELQTPADDIKGQGYLDSSLRFSILGDFKKGKTWLLSQLCSQEKVLHKFKPDKKMGMYYDEKGFIDDVTKGGQAHELGIKKRDQIIKVNGGDFKKEELDRLQKSGNEFTIQVAWKLCHDDVVHTPGLCWKRLSLANLPCILMDSKGENSPVSKITTENMNDRRAEETILRDILCKMSDAFIFLVNSLGMHEQKTLQSLCRQLARDKPFSQVLVVHNLKHIETNHEFEKAVEEIVMVHKKEGFRVSSRSVLDPETSTKSSVKTLTRPTVNTKMRESVPQTHFILGCEGCDSGKNNRYVFENLRQHFLFLAPRKRTKPIIDELSQVILESVPRYLKASAPLENIRIERDAHPDKQRPSWKMMKVVIPPTANGTEVKWELKSFEVDDYVPSITSDSSIGAPPYRISTINQTHMKVRIKLSGYSEEQLIEDLEAEDEEEGKRVLAIGDNGKMIGCRVKVFPSCLTDKKSDSDSILRESSSFAPEKLTNVDIELREHLDQDEIEASYNQGIIELTFPKLE